MANIVAPKYCLSILAALAAGSLKAVLVSTSTGPSGSNYSFNPLTSEFLSEVPAGAIIAPAVALTSLAAVLVGQVGNLNAGPVTFPAVPLRSGANAGQKAEAVLIYIDTGDATTSRIVNYDDSSANLPVAPNGTDIQITFPSAVMTLS